MLAFEVRSGTANSPEVAKKHFYRPELDVLRFVAFFLVFLTHGPRLNDQLWLGHFYNRLAGIGVYGLSLFFFLSSYLISELLLQEKERTGQIHLKAFYIRRILRIWPLYFVGIFIGVVLSLWHKPEFGLTRTELICFLLFVGYIPGAVKSPIGPLWSISVEELFYAIWPVASKFSGKILFRISLVIFPSSMLLASYLTSGSWYNPFVQFLFFAEGYIVAAYLHNRRWCPPALARPLLFVFGIAAWFSILPLYRLLSVHLAEPLGYVASAIGCLLIFLSILGMEIGRLLQPIVYLGKISYGLYVFHLPWLRVLQLVLISRVSRGTFALELIPGLVLTVATAALSYRFLERPFLNLKHRFEFIRTRRSSGFEGASAN